MKDCRKHIDKEGCVVIEGREAEDSGFETMSEENIDSSASDEEMKE
jgi:hypothetical protein